MPNIHQYQTPDLNIRPTELGVEATAAAARRGGAFFNQAAGSLASEGARLGSALTAAGETALRAEEHREITAATAKFAELQDNLTQQWNDTVKTANPNDPSIAGRFRDEVLQPALEKFGQGFLTENGQRYADAELGRLRQHMFEKTTADMATLAGQAVRVNTEQTINRLSSTVRSDPSSLDFSLHTLDSAVDGLIGSSPALTGTQAGVVRSQLTQKGKERIVRSAAFGYIEKTGEEPPWASDPKYAPYIDGQELKQFEAFAKAQRRAAATFQKQQTAQAVHTALSKNMTDNVSFDASGHATIKPDFFKNVMEIEAQFPGVATDRARSMISWGQAQMHERREPIVTDPQVQSDLYDGMFRTDNPTTDVDILKAAAADKLDPHATSTLLALHRALEEEPLKDKVFSTTLSGAKSLLGTDPVGLGKYAGFVQDFIPRYMTMKRAGTLPANALDLKDPSSLISQAMKPYQRAPAEIIRDRILRGEMNLSPAAATETPKPATNIPQNIPTPDKREKGKVYETPRGPLRWTGTGWVTP